MPVIPVTEAFRAITVAAAALFVALTWLAIRAIRLPAASPGRLIAELRLAQIGGMLLAFLAAVYVGFAAAEANRVGSGLDVALALGYFVVAAIAPTRDPDEALRILALAFTSHALVDILHRPGMLPVGVAPRWYVIGCAAYNVGVGGVCYLPLLRR